jgi:hypothetical protein
MPVGSDEGELRTDARSVRMNGHDHVRLTADEAARFASRGMFLWLVDARLEAVDGRVGGEAPPEARLTEDASRGEYREGSMNGLQVQRKGRGGALTRLDGKCAVVTGGVAESGWHVLELGVRSC